MKATPSVTERYEKALAQASEALSSLDVVRGRPTNINRGMRGWILEHTVRSCLEDEFKKRGLAPQILEQQSIGGRAKVDFVIDSVALEVKVSGFYSDVGPVYRDYRKRVEARGWSYFYLTLEERYTPNILSARAAFGRNRAFFLDKPGSWDRFLSELVRVLKRGCASTSA
jgi:hypothetical protein